MCVGACEHDAIFKEEKYGAVLVDQDKCQGDRNCFQACPYGAPKFASDEPGTKMSKCTLCIDRLEKGQLPLCVASCPMRALDFGPIDELVEKYGDVRQIETMPDPELTMPNWVAKANPPKEQLVPYDAERPSSSPSAAPLPTTCTRATASASRSSAPTSCASASCA